MTFSILMTNAQQGHAALTAHVWPHLRENLQAGRRMVVEVKQEKRSSQENRLLHSLLGHIADQIEWSGQKRDTETWKRLIVAAWCRARGENVEFLPAIDGKGVDIVFRRTSELTKAECAELIEFIYAWAAEVGVRFPAYEV